MLYFRSSGLIIQLKVYSIWPTCPHFPFLPSPGNHYFILCFYFFLIGYFFLIFYLTEWPGKSRLRSDIHTEIWGMRKIQQMSRPRGSGNCFSRAMRWRNGAQCDWGAAWDEFGKVDDALGGHVELGFYLEYNKKSLKDFKLSNDLTL